MNRDLPICRAEFYFPNIENPNILKAVLTEFKKEWDLKSESVHDLDEYCRGNRVIVQRIVRKPVMRTQRREFVEKRIFFTRGEAMQSASVDTYNNKYTGM